MFDALDLVDDRRSGWVIVLRQAVDLVDAEDGVGLHEGDLAFDLLAVSIGLGPADAVGVDDQAAGLALADTAAERERLAEGHPNRRGEAAEERLGPEQDDI